MAACYGFSRDARYCSARAPRRSASHSVKSCSRNRQRPGPRRQHLQDGEAVGSQFDHVIRREKRRCQRISAPEPKSCAIRAPRSSHGSGGVDCDPLDQRRLEPLFDDEFPIRRNRSSRPAAPRAAIPRGGRKFAQGSAGRRGGRRVAPRSARRIKSLDHA